MVLSRGRTGSTVIVDDIDLHPDICCYQEVFTPRPEDLSVQIYDEFEKKSPGPSVLEDYFQHLWNGNSKGAHALGYKVLISHVEGNQDRLNYLLSGRIKVIFSVRNSVGVALSGAIAVARDVYNVRADDTKRRSALQKAPPVVLDPQWIVNEVKYDRYWTKIWTERLQGAVDHIVLDYDHYIQNRATELNRCFEFLGQKAEPVADSRFIKVTSKAYADEIVNKAEVIDALHKAGFDLSPLIGDAN